MDEHELIQLRVLLDKLSAQSWVDEADRCVIQCLLLTADIGLDSIEAARMGESPDGQ